MVSAPTFRKNPTPPPKRTPEGYLAEGKVFDNTWGPGNSVNKQYGYWESSTTDLSKKLFTVAKGNKGTGARYTGVSEYGYVTEGRLGGGPDATPSWVDGTTTPGQATINRRAPLTPLGAVLLTAPEDQASLDTKGRGDFAAGNRTVVNRTTGRTREEEEDELRRGAILLR
jgi:hypothetical protein